MKLKPRAISTLIFLTVFSPAALAWDGTDMKRNAEITIDTGNLVREGSTIDFYDSSDGNYHTAQVVTMNSIFHGTEIVIDDITEGHAERTFIMREE